MLGYIEAIVAKTTLIQNDAALFSMTKELSQKGGALVPTCPPCVRSIHLRRRGKPAGLSLYHFEIVIKHVIKPIGLHRSWRQMIEC